MRILIENLSTTQIKHICRFNGRVLHIIPRDFIVFESLDIDEIKYWLAANQRNAELNKKGINVITEDRYIKGILKAKRYNKYVCRIPDPDITPDTSSVKIIKSVSINRNELSEIAVADTDNTTDTDTVNTDNTVEVNESDNSIQDNTIQSDEVLYTEEYLNSLDKTELFEILEVMDIPYKKNNSNTTLVKLIMNSDRNKKQ